MKNLFNYFALLLLMNLTLFSSNMMGQELLYKEDFEDIYCPETSLCGNIINDNLCFPGWATSHGTPGVVSSFPYEQDSCLFMVLNTHPTLCEPDLCYITEGAFYTEEDLFEEGKCYLLRFWYRYRVVSGDHTVDRLPNFKVELANGLTHNLVSCQSEEPTISDYQNVFTKNCKNLASENTAYTEAILTFTAENDFDQLWIYIDTDAEPAEIVRGEVRVDYLRLYEVDCEFPCSCPEPSTPVQIGSPGTTTLLSNLSYDGELPPGCYEIAGRLEIDEDIIAIFVNFMMQPGAEIRVDETSTFTVLSSNFEACYQMWKGISMKPGATLDMIDVNISDAQYAIYARSDLTEESNLTVKNTDFDRNYVGIYADGGGESINLQDNLVNNTFTCSSILLPPFDGQYPEPGEATFAGIYLNVTDGFNIGVSTNANIVNTFSGIRNGIIAFGSTFNAHYCEFTDLAGGQVDHTPPFITMSGIGIYALRCPNVNLSRNYLSRVYHGVLANDSHIKANWNNIDNNSGENTFGIKYMNCSKKVLQAVGNGIISRYGILVENNHQAEEILLNFNDIHVFPAAATGGGILVSNSSTKLVPPKLQMNWNEIIGEVGMYAGIRLESSGNWQIMGNNPIIGDGSFYTGAGILLNNSWRCQVRQNNISGKLSRGIDVSQSPDVLYCCNELDGPTTGMKFNLTSSFTRVKANQFQKHSKGLHYTASGITGQQGGDDDPSANSWHSESITDDAIHESNNELIWGQSLYYTHLEQAPVNPIPEDWFVGTSGPERNCSNWLNCDEAVWLTPYITRLDTTIANRSLDTLPYGHSLQWAGSQQLYRRLQEYPDLLNNNSLMQSFAILKTPPTSGNYMPSKRLSRPRVAIAKPGTRFFLCTIRKYPLIWKNWTACMPYW